ncbi:NAD-dependent epimerase/dehydratase [Rhodomicrobium vannielii ATCC 17100]|uniref:NAD-dependent epimerase/dehydratase n=1 Tax=Rhodomicrobium vannielii (strain ATCC 17100 / DSM 162 / LMG 4299 / NCIMB 10020 / ATH 3.1.1) TaxID=648757 RepID=E3I6B4_RHOVT|nr:NAD-dependent epimerase [Rhodomicrobium vannielii]ADP69475.1 NAD-dependent epimerase/dehydratase [Rhodomicrobium vannielii ATCC 17100]
MTILVTGAAGFIGFHVAKALLARGEAVVGFDNINSYYDPSLKHARLEHLAGERAFTFVKADLADADAVRDTFARFEPRRVVHLAAQAGVRYSLQNPQAYLDSNVIGLLNILEGCRAHRPEHLVFASSSSVYGLNTKLPFAEADKTDAPASLYGATKKSGELMAHAYAHLFNLPMTGLRFFTVYGPWGRPDMSPIIFTKAIIEGRPIDLFNNGDHARDFTYIDDIVDGVLRVVDMTPVAGASGPAFEIYNIGHNEPVPLNDFVACIEDAIGKKAIRNLLPMQPGDVPETHADIERLAAATGFRPTTPIEVGIPRFVRWYRDYYQV